MTRPPPPRAPRVRDAQFVAGASKVDQLPPPRQVEVAFAGRSNVGKSSLLNALLERKKLVRTSSTPGCTRQVSLFEVTTAGGSRLMLADLPGYGYAKRSHTERREWAGLIDAYLLERQALALLVVLVDIRRGVEADDRQLLELMQQAPRVSRAPVDVLLVATKIDKLSSSERKLALTRLERATGQRWQAFSTEIPETHAQLWRQILGRLGLDQAPRPPATRP